LGIEDRDWYREEIREREVWSHPLSMRPRREGRDTSAFWVATWCVIFVAATGGTLVAKRASKIHPPAEVVMQQPTPAKAVDPFADDPTWHTGPRPVVQVPEPSSSMETREVTKCIVNGHVSYGGSGDCRGGTMVTVPIAAGPTYEEQQEAQARADDLAERASAIDRRLAWEQWRRDQVVVRTAPSNLATTSECAALDAAIRGYDAQARQPLPPGMQDLIKDQRASARSRQFALHC